MTSRKPRKPRGRPRSEATCSRCGAPKCRQRHTHAAVPAVQAVARTRHWFASIALPGGGQRDLFMLREQDAIAARAAVSRDPSLALAIAADEYQDMLPEGGVDD